MNKPQQKTKFLFILGLVLATIFSLSFFSFLKEEKAQAQTPSVTGVVLKPDGVTPMPHVGVSLHSKDWTKKYNVGTDDQGRYAFFDIEPSIYLLDAFVPQEVGESIVSPPSVEITVVTGQTVTQNITLLQATKHVEGYVKYKDGATVTDAGIHANRRDTEGWTDSRVNNDGYYKLNMVGGSWEVMVSGRFDEQGRQVPVDWAYMGPPQSISFASDASEETKRADFEVVKATATIKGKILRPDGSAATDIHVDARNKEGQGNSGQTDQDGYFNFKVPAGNYFLSVHSNDPRLSAPSLNIEAKENETNDLGTITLTIKNSQIQGRLLSPEGTGLPDLEVHSFQKDNPGDGGHGRTDASGSYSLWVTAGKWELMPDQRSESDWIYSGPPQMVTIADGQTITGVDFSMIKADAQITGLVKDDSGNVLSDLYGHAEAMPLTPGPPSGGGQIEKGSFRIKVPHGTYKLNAWIPPEIDYSVGEGPQVTVGVNETATADITLQKNNARIQGVIKDVEGKVITNLKGKIFFHNKGHNFKEGEIKGDGTFNVSLLAGTWFMGTWIDPESGYMNQEFRDPITVNVGETAVKTLTFQKADTAISGTVLDPDGKPASHVWIWADNHRQMEGKVEGPFKGGYGISVHTETDANGKFNMPIVSGTYEVGVGVDPERGWMNPDIQEVEVTPQKKANLSFKFGKPDGYIKGDVTKEGKAVGFAWVWAWSEKGKHSGTPVKNDGKYSLPITKNDIWHFGADADDGDFFYQSDEVTLSVGDNANATQNLVLEKGVRMPPPVTTTFDATQAKVITLEDGTVINIPANALASSGNVTVIATPKGGLYHQKSDKPIGLGYNLEALDSDRQPITSSFNSEVTIIMTYTEEQLKNLGITEEDLLGKYWDEPSGAWKKPDDVIVDTEGNEITIRTRHFTEFAVVSVGSGEAVLPAKIITGTGEGSGPQVNIYDAKTKLLSSFFAYDKNLRTGVNVASGDLNGDNKREIITGPARNGGPQVKVFDENGKLLSSFFAYSKNLRSGVNVAAGDLNGDGKAEIITGMGQGAGPQIKIFNREGKLLSTFFAFDSRLRTGVNIGIADLNGDDKYEILASPGQGGGPQVKVFDKNGKLLSSFFAFSSSVRTGIKTTGGDLNGDGKDEIIVGAGQGSGPQVKVFNANAKLLSTFFAYDSKLRTGVNVAAGDLSASGKDVIITAPGKGGGPQVKVFNDKAKLLTNFFPYLKDLRNGVNLATGAF